MTVEKPPLALLVEPDEYLCTWLLPSPDGAQGAYAGSIDLRADRSPAGSVFGSIPIQWFETHDGESVSLPQRLSLPHIQTRLENGYVVDLVDVTISYWAPDRGHIVASSATVGAPDSPPPADHSSVDPDAPTYSLASAQVGALDAVSAAAPFSEWKFPHSDDFRHLQGDWTVTGNPESSQSWSDDSATVRLEYDATVSVGNPYSFRFVVSPVVRIELNDSLTIRDWVDQWIDPLRRIISIATGDAEPLTYLAVSSAKANEGEPSRFLRRQVYGSGIKQMPYQSDQASVQATSTALRIAEDGLSLLDMLRRWQDLQDEHHPLIETYGSMLTATDDHPRSRFLLLLQALEGLHGHETSAKYEERKVSHAADREALLTALKNTDAITSSQRRFLRRNLSKLPIRGLAQALEDLLAQLPVDLVPQLSVCSLLARHPDEHVTANNQDETRRIASALGQVRNDLSHGNRGFDAYELNETVDVLERIVRAHTLRVLGCPESVLERACRRD